MAGPGHAAHVGESPRCSLLVARELSNYVSVLVKEPTKRVCVLLSQIIIFVLSCKQGNCIGPDGAAALAEALRSNTSLTRLYIDGAGIKARGACAVASALVTNNVLRYV